MAGAGVLVDGRLDGQQQLRDALNLVDDQKLRRVDEADRVGGRRSWVVFYL